MNTLIPVSRNESYLYHLYSYGEEIRTTSFASEADDWIDLDAFNTVTTELITYIFIFGFAMVFRAMVDSSN